MSDDPLPEDIAELLRQRNLVVEHLRWLDAELARRLQDSPPSTQPPAPPPAPRAEPPPPLHSPLHGHQESVFHSETDAPENLPQSAEVAANRIMGEYHASRGNVRDEVRRGCLLYFGLAFLALSAVLGAVYLYHRAHPEQGLPHPHDNVAP